MKLQERNVILNWIAIPPVVKSCVSNRIKSIINVFSVYPTNAGSPQSKNYNTYNSKQLVTITTL